MECEDANINNYINRINNTLSIRFTEVRVNLNDEIDRINNTLSIRLIEVCVKLDKLLHVEKLVTCTKYALKRSERI